MPEKRQQWQKKTIDACIRTRTARSCRRNRKGRGCRVSIPMDTSRATSWLDCRVSIPMDTSRSPKARLLC